MSMRNLSSSTFLLSFCPTSGQASLSSSSELPESSAPSLPWAPSIGVCIKSRHRKIFPLAPTPNHSKNQSHLHSQLTLVLLRIWPEGSFLGSPPSFYYFLCNKIYFTSIDTCISFFLTSTYFCRGMWEAAPMSIRGARPPIKTFTLSICLTTLLWTWWL